MKNKEIVNHFEKRIIEIKKHLYLRDEYFKKRGMDTKETRGELALITKTLQLNVKLYEKFKA